MTESIALATPSDASAIAELVNRAYRPASDAAGWTHESALVQGERTSPAQVAALMAQPDSVVLRMTQGSALLACVHIERSGCDCWIGMLATRPGHQNTGLGKRMLAAAEAEAIARFAPQRLCMSVLTWRPELLAFYQRRGYQRTGQVHAYPHDAGVGVPIVEVALLELAKPAGL